MIQGAVLSLFLIFLWFMPRLKAGDIFVQFDPLASAVLTLAARKFLPDMIPGLIVITSAFFFGRFVCGHICPMGTTVDIMGTVLRKNFKPWTKKIPDGLYRLKYILLAFVAGAALIKINLFFWLSPLPLVSRFYTILIQPFTTLLGNKSLFWAQPALSMINAGQLEYLQITVRRFDGIYFILFFFALIFSLELIRPRFWCRYICPAGALLGICSKMTFWRRRVHKCNKCGVCAKKCSTGAIVTDGKDIANNEVNFSAPPQKSGEHTAYSECITCRKCVDICNINGVTFAFLGKKQPSVQGILPARRTFMIAAGGGAGFAALEFLDLRTITSDGKEGTVYPETFVRPPGALPEKEFLSRCLRCGLCMRVCPTNGLQPATIMNGSNFGSMFSPVLVSRRGPCEPDCNLCGVVCPSQAIRGLPLKEKRWAKIGTSVVIPGRCLAWNNSKSCVVCQEVCPYGAVKIVPMETASAMSAAAYFLDSKYPVPVVTAEKCFGCGYCEKHCPASAPAIITVPLNPLRISEKDYEVTGKEQGLMLELVNKSAESPENLFPMEKLSEGSLPPGFTD
jgi:ferredoxin